MHHRPPHPGHLYCTGLPPVIGGVPVLLILGSFPSRTSLDRIQYYANPHNQFWQIIGPLLGIDRHLAYDRRIEQLIRNRIALWDVISTCQRRGSADHHIRNPSLNPVRELLNSYPGIGAVIFNGTTASRYAPGLRLQDHIKQVTLPSTSPANTRFTLAEKTVRWGILLDILNPAE
jgi:TDG/mug DNA glycosylase family protein